MISWLNELNYKNKINPNTFKSMNKETAYWLGFLYDNFKMNVNCVRLNPRFSLEEHFPKLDKFIGDVKLLNDKSVKGKVRIYSSSDLVKTLTSYGFHPKEFDADNQILFWDVINNNLENIVPIEFRSHFIRGLVDSNGTISINSTQQKYVIVSSPESKDLQIIERWINLSVGVIATIQKNIQRNNYQIIYTANRCDKLVEWLYNESTEDIRVKSKYDVYSKMKEVPPSPGRLKLGQKRKSYSTKGRGLGNQNYITINIKDAKSFCFSSHEHIPIGLKTTFTVKDIKDITKLKTLLDESSVENIKDLKQLRKKWVDLEK